MKARLAFLSFVFPAALSAQFLGHPAGRARFIDYAGQSKPPVVSGTGIEFGFTRKWKVDGTYTTERLPSAGKATSHFEEIHGAIRSFQGLHLWSYGHLETGLMIGGLSHEIRDARWPSTPYDDGIGAIAGFNLRYGFPKLGPFRFGFGGQVTGSYSYGSAKVDRDGVIDRDSFELWLFRGQAFCGGGFDIPLLDWIYLCPYGGAGVSSLTGRLNHVHRFWEESHKNARNKAANLDENRLVFYYAGLDTHITSLFKEKAQLSLSFEAQTNGKGWFMGVFFGLLWDDIR